MRLSFEAGKKQIELAQERNKVLNAKMNKHVLIPEHKVGWYVEENHPSVIGSHLRNINLWSKPISKKEVWAQHVVTKSTDDCDVTIDYVIDGSDNRFISVLKEDPSGKKEAILSISYHGDRSTFSTYLKRFDLSEDDFVRVGYYTTDETDDIKPWQSRNEHLISTYKDGNMKPLINNMLRIFSTGFKYTWDDEDDELVEMYNEHINHQQVERLLEARRDYQHLVHQLATPIASEGLLKYLTRETK